MKKNAWWLLNHSLTIVNSIGWVVSLPSNSHHKDYYICSRESEPKTSFDTVTDVTGWGLDPTPLRSKPVANEGFFLLESLG